MSYLWALNSEGKVFILSTAGDHWVELQDHGIDFKKLSAHEFFTWGISGDHQIYIYVPSKDIPIRCCVVTYENERWNPLHGFSSKLLPTDRPHWSSADGLVSLPQESFTLPSKSWEWEEEWYVEDNLEGQPLEPEGWTYAIDFPANYGPSKTWNSLVRRRKWIRYRRYCATNKWSLIPSIHEDPILEPFIDISIGGTEIPGGEPDNFAVWAVTVMGRVVFRYGVTAISPEGNGWVPVNTPDQCDVSQIFVGPTGLVWAVTLTGYALARLGITRENIMGSDWIIIDPPSNEDILSQVTVGTNVVWALSKNNKVWFRKNIDGFHSGENEMDAIGSRWIEMFGKLSMISIGIDDQVFSISSDGHNILFRTGVDVTELCGRTWKIIEVAQKRLRHTSSLSSFDSTSNLSHKDSIYSSETSLDNKIYDAKKATQNSISSSPVLKREKSISFDCIKFNADAEHSFEVHDIQNFDNISTRTSSYCEIDNSYHSEVTGLLWQSAIENIENHFCYEIIWTWISANGCLVDPDSLPNWFSEGSSICHTVIDEPWYEEILQQLKKRHAKEVKNFSSYPRAIEKSTWIKSGTCRVYSDYQWVTCLLELIQQSEYDSQKSTLTYLHRKDQVVIPLNAITCVVALPDWNKTILNVHTAKRTIKGSPYKFAFSSNEDLEDWLASLNSSCRLVNNLSWIPEQNAAWSLTVNGEVYVHNPSFSIDTELPSHMHWSLIGGGHLRIVESGPAGITWGLGYNCTVWAYNKGYGGGPYRGIPGCNVSVGPMYDTRYLYIYENQRWNPLTGFTAKGLPTDRYMWSDQTGRIECTKDNTHLPSCHWQWISDWCIDYKTPGGVDNEGWQYATDFPRSYHGYKRFTDYVRRRRWYRKCRLNTSGPWKQLGTTPLLDVSFQLDPCKSSNEPIAVWAIAINGDVLFRIGVTQNCPTGQKWAHVPAEKPFCSITVGGDGAVWAVAKDGSAHLRHGVCSTTPTGLYWCHVEAPQIHCPLRQISAGKSIVLAVDENNRLWSRQEIIPIYKEGTHWKLISEDVQQVSVGALDQIWCIKNKVETSSGKISGVVCKRSGINDENKYGTDWLQGIGGLWSYISIRACLFDTE